MKNIAPQLSAEFVRSILDYDPLTGIFRWKVARGRRVDLIGAIAGGVDLEGYWMIRIGCARYKAHRLAWLVMTGEMPDRKVDHRNLNTIDNSWDNLRLATDFESAQNRGISRNNPTGFKGVTFDKKHQCFRARIAANGRQFFLGHFDTAAEGGEAYAIAAARLHGEFARAA